MIDKNVQELRRISKEKFIPVMLDEGMELLIATVKKHSPKKILEIGTATGCSGISMLLNSEGSHLTTIEQNEESFSEATKNFETFNLCHNVTQILGDAKLILPKLVQDEKKFDFIFLDGPKARYVDYLPFLTILLENEGILLADNIGFRGYVDSDSEYPKKYKNIVLNLREFLKIIQNDKLFKTNIYKIGDGISISQKQEYLKAKENINN